MKNRQEHTKRMNLLTKNIVRALFNNMQVFSIFGIISRRRDKALRKVLIKDCFMIQAEITVLYIMPTCAINPFYLVEFFNSKHTHLNN